MARYAGAAPAQPKQAGLGQVPGALMAGLAEDEARFS